MKGETSEKPGAAEGGKQTPSSVRKALAAINSRLESHAGGVDVVEVTDSGVVKLAFKGACIGCPARATTYAVAVLPAIEEACGVTAVEMKELELSRRAILRIRSTLG